MNKKGFVLSTYVYMLLVFFLLLLGTMLAVLNNTRLLSEKLKEQSGITSGLVDKDFSFILLGDKDIVQGKGIELTDPGYRIQTSKGTDLSDIVKVESNVNYNVVGSYTITYTATHNGITKELVRNVDIVENIGATYIRNLYLEGSTDLQEPMVEIDGVETSTGVRYVGANPANYVYFNCEPKDSSGVSYGKAGYSYSTSCEKWRIIGVFDVDRTINGVRTTESRVKIIRDPFTSTNNSTGFMSAIWDSSDASINTGWGINQWGEIKDESGNITYEGADLMRLLNGYYIKKANATCVYCTSLKQATCQATSECNNIKQINEFSLRMLEYAIWSIRPGTTSSVSQAYISERTATPISCKTDGSAANCNDEIQRTAEWEGKIGLLYPSDYGYASLGACASLGNATCGNSNWLNIGTDYSSITPNQSTTYGYYAYGPSKNGNIGASAGSKAFRPTLYLKSTVNIATGDGTEENPYILSI